jgi:hypothetical protein
MKTNLRHWAGAAVVTAAALALSSCVYDPYYASSGSYGYGGGGGYGYGEGYGYGNSNFSTSVFVSTGDPRWGYDPTCYSYYDYHRRCYYDPYMNGYYPIGYRPPVVYGVPHPHGWHPGLHSCPPPRHVSHITLTNYHHRAVLYQKSNYAWAKKVHQGPPPHDRVQNQNFGHKTYNKSNSGSHPYSGTYNPNIQKHDPKLYTKNLNPGYHPSNNASIASADSSRQTLKSGKHPNPFQQSTRQLPPQNLQRVNRADSHLNARGDNSKRVKETKSSKEEKRKGSHGFGQD